MDNSWIDPVVWIVLGVVSLGAVLTGVGLVIKAFSFQNHYLASSINGILALAILSSIGLLGPLALLAGKQYQQSHLLADLLMFGVSGLVVLGVVFFIIDHLQERPGFLMLAAAASLSIGVFPWIYILNVERFNKLFDISIIAPEKLPSLGLDPLEGQRASLSEASSVAQAVESDAAETEVDPASRFIPLTPPPKPITVQTADEAPSINSDEVKGSDKDWLYDDP